MSILSEIPRLDETVIEATTFARNGRKIKEVISVLKIAEEGTVNSVKVRWSMDFTRIIDDDGICIPIFNVSLPDLGDERLENARKKLGNLFDAFQLAPKAQTKKFMDRFGYMNDEVPSFRTIGDKTWGRRDSRRFVQEGLLMEERILDNGISAFPVKLMWCENYERLCTEYDADGGVGESRRLTSRPHPVFHVDLESREFLAEGRRQLAEHLRLFLRAVPDFSSSNDWPSSLPGVTMDCSGFAPLKEVVK